MASFIILSAGVSGAHDICVSLPSATGPGPFLVGRGFNSPGKGQCSPWKGFALYLDRNRIPIFAGASLGTGCLSSDGRTFSLTVHTVYYPGGFVAFDSIGVSPGFTFNETELDISGFHSYAGYIASFDYCGGVILP